MHAHRYVIRSMDLRVEEMSEVRATSWLIVLVVVALTIPFDIRGVWFLQIGETVALCLFVGGAWALLLAGQLLLAWSENILERLIVHGHLERRHALNHTADDSYSAKAIAEEAASEHRYRGLIARCWHSPDFVSLDWPRCALTFTRRMIIKMTLQPLLFCAGSWARRGAT